MDQKKINLARARVYQFLSTLYRDEIPQWLVQKMAEDDFADKVGTLLKSCTIQDLCSGLNKMTADLQSGSAREVFKKLRYEYADLFLNAGANPTFPYESCYTNQEPLVMQTPVAELRALYRKAGVHKNKEFMDIDDHIAVELEFMRYQAEKAAFTQENQEEHGWSC